MTAAGRIVSAGPTGLAILLAVLWPVSASILNPAIMPATLAIGAALVAILIRPAYGLAWALMLAPFLNTVVSTGGQLSYSGKPFQVLVPALAGGVLAYSAVLSGDQIRGTRSRWLSVAILSLGVSALLSSTQAIEPSASLNKLALLATGIVLFLGVRAACRDRGTLNIVLAGALAGLALASLQGLSQQLSGVYSEQGFVAGGEVVGRVQGSFGHPNLYGGYLALLIPVAATTLAQARNSPGMRWLAATALALALPALALAYARGAILGLVAGALIWLALTNVRRALAVGAALLVAAALLMPATLRERFDPQSSEGDITLRADIWNAAFQIYGTSPAFGVGPNQFSNAYSELPSTGANASQRRLLHQDQLLVPPHPQSNYLQALAEGGLLGALALAAFLGFGVVACYRGARSMDPGGRALGTGVGIGLLGILIHSLVEVPLTSEIILPLMALLGAVAVHLDLDDAEGTSQHQP